MFSSRDNSLCLAELLSHTTASQGKIPTWRNIRSTHSVPKVSGWKFGDWGVPEMIIAMREGFVKP